MTTINEIYKTVKGRLRSGAYEYAMEQTTKELQQAVEGMYHNLNSLQSRSGGPKTCLS